MINDDSYTKTALDTILEDELELEIYRLGSYLSMLYDKHLGVVNVFDILLRNVCFREAFLEMLGSDWKTLAIFMVQRYPLLCKSKRINVRL